MSVYPLKNWTLNNIVDGGCSCGNCGTTIRWEYHISHYSGFVLVVGSECVKALTDECDPKAAKALKFDNWKSRRTYFYKRVGRITYIVGVSGGSWYAATSQEGVTSKWTFLPRQFAKAQLAKDYLAYKHTRRADAAR